MYNYFVDEKRKKEEEIKALQEKKAQKYKDKRHKQDFPLLVNNYERRIKNFVFEMATSKSPTLIKDYINPIESTRKQFMHEEVSKIKGRAGFVFKGFLTEKERIKEYLDKKNTIYMEKYLNLFKDDHLNETKQLETKKFVQPTMRFKPRNDLERIYDSINSVYYGSVSKERLKRHFKTLRTHDNQEDDESSDDENQEQNMAHVKRAPLVNESLSEDKLNVYNVKSVNEELKKKSFLNSNDSRNKEFKGKFKRDNKKSKRRFVDNSEARGFRKELYNKTHFKAATDLTIFKKINNSPEGLITKPIRTCEIEIDKISDYNENDEVEFNKTCTTTKESEKVYKEILGRKDKGINDVEDFKLITRNPLIKSINLKEEEHIDENVLTKLKKMSTFSTISTHKNVENKPKKSVHFIKYNKILGKNFQEIVTKNVPGMPSIKAEYVEDGQKKKDDERITINDSTYLKSDVDLISREVLRRCNYFHDKSKNSMKIPKKGEGKLMFTNGMTVSEFQQRYISINNK